MYFTRRNQAIPQQYISILSRRSIRLQMPITSPRDEDNYVCKLNKTNGELEIIGNQFVTVEYEPKIVENISCRVYNWEMMNCTWDLGVDYNHPENINVTLPWAIDKHYDCPHLTRTSCTWLPVDGPDSFKSDMTYLMKVNIKDLKTKKEYQASKTYTATTSLLVEPASVKNVTVSRNSSCISLQWKHERMERQLFYKVQFQSQWNKSDLWEVIDVGLSNSLTLCDLLPFTNYTFNITCIPYVLYRNIDETERAAGFWSKGKCFTVQTSEDVPLKAPEVHVGNFIEQLSCSEYRCRKIWIFWKPVDKKYSGGHIERYNLDYYDVDHKDHFKDFSTGSSFFKSIHIYLEHSYILKIAAVNAAGVSQHNATLFIPASEKKPTVPELIVEADSLTDTIATLNFTIFNHLSELWKQLTNFTIYWCKGYKPTQICQEPINWMDVPISQTQITLKLPRLVDENLFGLSVQALTWDDQVISSGFIWNTCTYIRNTKPLVPPRNVELCSFQPNRALCIQWERLLCPNTRAFVKHYEIMYCKADQELNCSGEVIKLGVSNRFSSFTLYDLDPGVRYRVWLQALSEEGASPTTEPIFQEVVDRRLNPSEIGGIAVGSLFFLIIFLFGAILCTRRLYRTVKHKYFEPVPIDVPNTLPPLPPIPMPPPIITPGSESSSDGIYEKIPSPPSPTSSVGSVGAGAEAPLILSKFKMWSSKTQIYSSKKENRLGRNNEDSGHRSLSQSADTLLMRLHPSIFARLCEKKSKKNYSDSGIVSDSKGSEASEENNSKNLQEHSDENQDKTGEVNPYSCVNIVEKIEKEINISRKASINRKGSTGDLPKTDSADQAEQYNGSTLSLPPVSCTLSTFSPKTLDFRTKSADNELDFEGSKLMRSNGTSIDESLGDETDECESHESGNGYKENYDQQVNSYVKCQSCDTFGVSNHLPGLQKCSQCSDSNPSQLGICIEVSKDGYIQQGQILHNYSYPCDDSKSDTDSSNGEYTSLRLNNSLSCKPGTRPVSQVMNLPPHFYNSLSLMPMDPSNTTEL
ncbi:hypothetical protein ACJMK2_040630 [Sinanodonta woodiana]|uniref:Fibronectin type-III domain-containing protein n=1 Tax=Sinanodonta woodiana TaxID=1069815 RepID=A0ABD3W1L9_SINWO